MPNENLNRSILKLAIPNIVSNITVPLLGLVDMILMGHSRRSTFTSASGFPFEQLSELHQRLKDLGCLGITVPKGHEYVTILYRHVGFCTYSYEIHFSPMTEEQRDESMNDLRFIPYNERVVFVFRGGAVSPRTFPPEAKEDFLNKHKPW